jgi:hypothetical protein
MKTITLNEQALDQIQVQIPLRRIIRSDGAIDYFGLNPWCVAEGADGDTLYTLPVAKAIEFGILEGYDE